MRRPTGGVVGGLVTINNAGENLRDIKHIRGVSSFFSCLFRAMGANGNIVGPSCHPPNANINFIFDDANQCFRRYRRPAERCNVPLIVRDTLCFVSLCEMFAC